ncbi:aspartate aminotransferase family protein [Corynebacterium lactis]|uniref:Glutamate-1-semialdehyde aminotransferase n=1 Tax=Corynebacterium lactis RW2-5 TaxID=1408189 RepID=A0A0K2H261_9CORY|nr:aminotransferase class III-fold pyridoxal phosphate-dependent enzyme [Corynebacterium lactis]ALA67781.1 glutamate-1-semialdehyde aminotransferase [Corynebacterium lactis RW2-5]
MDINRPGTAQVIRELDDLIKRPIHSISPEYLKKVETEHFDGKCTKSKEMVEHAGKVIPGGVQHNLAFNHPFPLAFDSAKGAKLYDVDGNKYLDFLQAGGPTVLGSNPDSVREKVEELLDHCGPSTGLLHEYEVKLAQLIVDLVPSVDKFRMFNSGSEACSAAARVARLATGNKHILKMGGAYHGWSDQLAFGIRIPGSKFTQSKGLPLSNFVFTEEFFPGDLKALERNLKLNKLRGGTAAIFLEPVGPESGTRPISAEFVQGARELATKYGALLVFDEVVTAFRLSPHGAQHLYGVTPDLTVFGKVIAGGYPGAGGLGGPDKYMQYLAAGIHGDTKIKKALVGGTMAATPLSSLAGYYTLKEIAETGACEKASAMGDRLTDGLREIIARRRLPFVAFNQGSICHLETVGTMHFALDWSKPWEIPDVIKQTSARKAEMEHMGAAYMAEGIVTLAGSRLYTSAAYTEELIDEALTRFDRIFEHVVEL